MIPSLAEIAFECWIAKKQDKNNNKTFQEPYKYGKVSNMTTNSLNGYCSVLLLTIEWRLILIQFLIL